MSKRNLALVVAGLLVTVAGFALPVVGYRGNIVGMDVALGVALAIFGGLGLRRKVEV